jgi:ABC-2 type transport system ATP-binding protein
MYAIEATNLTKSFRGAPAVDGLDLFVEEGDVVALLGPNGAGKTTTLMMLLGITEPDEGTVRLLGHRLPQERTAALQETNFTASYISLPQEMRIRHFLWIYADIYGVPRSRVEEVVDLLGIGDLMKRQTDRVSSGQRTLIGLAKALLNRPRLLVLDEPTASLDPEVAAGIRHLLLSLHEQEEFTLLITSHNMAEIERLCRRVVFIAHGRIVADGAPGEIAARYGAEDLESTFLSIAAESRQGVDGIAAASRGLAGPVASERTDR